MKDTLIKATSRQGFDRVFALSGRLTALLALTLASVWPATLVAEEVVNVYSARHYDTDMALYEEFTRQTGIKVNLIEGGSDALIERIVNEGEFTPADMLITVDAGRLWRASEKNIFQPVESQVMDQRVPANLRDPDGLWFGLSKRVRAIAYNKAAGLPIDVMRYEDLANPALTDSVCMRSSSNIYNLSLMGSIIEAAGEAAAEAWAPRGAGPRGPLPRDTWENARFRTSGGGNLHMYEVVFTSFKCSISFNQANLLGTNVPFTKR